MTQTKSMSVTQAVKQIENGSLVLPSIQRNFVWKRKQIAALFDSLMRGFPIGTMLLWNASPLEKNVEFLKPVTDFSGDQQNKSLATRSGGKPVQAVLDGQQRLTALNIGLRGSMRTSANAAQQQLYINLDENTPEADAESNQYQFEFREPGKEGPEPWFPVNLARGLGLDTESLTRRLDSMDIAATAARRKVLKVLATVLADSERVTFISVNGDLNKALHVFARINSGGTTLSYSDLVLSTVSTRWPTAKNKVADLRRTLDDLSPEGFRFTEDRILKSMLILSDPTKPKFEVQRFLTMRKDPTFSNGWEKFRSSMILAARLLDDFGLSGQTLSAQNIIIPIAFYAYHRDLKQSYLQADKHRQDRSRIKAFVARTLLQRNFWTGAVDGVLTATCTAIKNNGSDRFPLEAIEDALATKKSISVDEKLVKELLGLNSADRRAIVLLRMLYPPDTSTHDKTKPPHKDHIFPISKFQASSPKPPGVPVTEWPAIRARADTLCNLQVLLAAKNQVDKKAKMPSAWLKGVGSKTRAYCSTQHVKYVPDSLSGAPDFWDKRSEKLEEDIRSLLQC